MPVATCKSVKRWQHSNVSFSSTAALPVECAALRRLESLQLFTLRTAFGAPFGVEGDIGPRRHQAVMVRVGPWPR
eukprot:s353_g17.t1